MHLIPYQLISNDPPEELTIVYQTEVYQAGNALIQLLTFMGGVFLVPALLLKLIPKSLLQKLYYWFANNRYHWFGTTSCPLP